MTDLQRAIHALKTADTRYFHGNLDEFIVDSLEQLEGALSKVGELEADVFELEQEIRDREREVLDLKQEIKALK